MQAKAIDRAAFERVAARDEYYKPVRWAYYRKAIDLAGDAITGRVLELGPYKLPLYEPCDTMDFRNPLGRVTYSHDARQCPWPCPNAHYQLFVALQVWEHLDGQQADAFLEASRIASNVLLSVPYRWVCPRDERHHMVTEEQIAEWTHAIVPTKSALVGDKRKRMVLYFDEFSLQPLRTRST